MDKDVATALSNLIPGAEYHGSLTPNNRAAYERIRWLDARAQPAWRDIEAEMQRPDDVVPDMFPPVTQQNSLDGLNEVRAYLSVR